MIRLEACTYAFCERQEIRAPLDTMNKEMAASVLQEFLQPVQVLLDHAVLYLFVFAFCPPEAISRDFSFWCIAV